MSLSDAKIRSIKPSDKPFKLTDSQGLYLLVNPGGSRISLQPKRIPNCLRCLSAGLTFRRPSAALTVSGNCWRRISIPHSSA